MENELKVPMNLSLHRIDLEYFLKSEPYINKLKDSQFPLSKDLARLQKGRIVLHEGNCLKKKWVHAISDSVHTNLNRKGICLF